MSKNRRTPSSVPFGTVFACCLGIAFVVPTASIGGEASGDGTSSGETSRGEKWTLPISVRAKSIAKEKEPVDARPIGMRRPPVPLRTQPDMRLPQYQLGYRQRNRLRSQQRESGELWLQLTHNKVALSIRATLRIDGKPFAQARNEQVEHLTSIAKQSDDPTDEPKKVPTTEEDLIRRYAVATGEPVTLEETEWLMANWKTGPTLLLLKDPFQWYRSVQRPVFQILDRDQDGLIDTEEMQSAAQSLDRCDTNGDEIVDMQEIDRATQTITMNHVSFSKRIRLLPSAPPLADLEIEIDFYTGATAQSKLTLTKIHEELRNKITDLHATESAILFHVGSRPYEVSAVEGNPSDQISLGAVVEGYRLLSAADPNADGRVTVRERRSFVNRLQQSDSNGDGELTGEETRPMTRLCFARGAIVHQELVKLRGSDPKTLPTGMPPTDQSKTPDWFTRMDRNQDQDLSRLEFSGTDEQFEALDFDHDELIATEEAIRFDQQTEPR